MTPGERRPGDRDASLGRVERDAVIVLAVMAATALLLQGGRPEGALGVLGGGALMGISYRAIKRVVNTLTARAGAGDPSGAEREPPDRAKRAVVWFVFRYALLAAGAYVILMPLRAHPLGVFAGVTAPVVAIALEAVRLQWQKRG